MDLLLQFQKLIKEILYYEDFVQQIKTIGDHLVAIDELVIEHDLVLYVSGGLNSCYNSFISSVTMRTDSVYLNQVHSMLLSY